MGKTKPFEKIVSDVKSNDVVILHLDGILDYDHHPVGYIWGTGLCPLSIYPTSGTATSSDKLLSEITNRGVDISNETYLGMKILGYEILRRGERD